LVHARRRGEGKNRNRTHKMRLIVVCLRTSQKFFPSHPSASALPQNGRLPAVGGGRGNVGCPMLWQRKPPQIALVNCYVDLPPLDEFDRTEGVGSRP
jgi:hypothetical protein